MKLQARVRHVTGRTTHSVGTIVSDQVVPVENMPAASRVELVREGESYFLYRYSASGEFAGDTWHQTIKEAKHQAEWEYEIRDSDWKPGMVVWDHEEIARGSELKGAIQDVPDSARRPDETDSEYALRMLLKHLQTLAADPDALLQAYPAGAQALDELVNDFSHYLKWSKTLVEEGVLTEDYFEAAELVEGSIDRLSGRKDPRCWTDEALRKMDEWSLIRHLSKDALIKMGFDPEPPPPGSM